MHLPGAAAVVVVVVSVLLPWALARQGVGPGPWRLLLVSPLVAVHLSVPLVFFERRQLVLRMTLGFLSSWLVSHKLIAWAWLNRGPLATATSSPLRFAVALLLPMVLDDGASTTKKKKKEEDKLVHVAARCIVKIAFVFVAAGWADAHNAQTRWFLFPAIVYAMASWLMDVPSLLTRLATTDLSIAPHFDEPYASCSLAEFWADRWNILVSSLLRDTVYAPVRIATGSRPAGVMASFCVSAVAHVLVLWYATRRISVPWACFFLLQGLLVCGEAALGLSQRSSGWSLIACARTLGVMLATAELLFFQPLVNDGTADKLLEAFQTGNF